MPAIMLKSDQTAVFPLVKDRVHCIISLLEDHKTYRKKLIKNCVLNLCSGALYQAHQSKKASKQHRLEEATVYTGSGSSAGAVP